MRPRKPDQNCAKGTDYDTIGNSKFGNQMIDKKTIEHIAKLSRLSVTEAEAQTFSEQLTKALDHFKKISELNTEGVEPLVTPSEIESIWREDVFIKMNTTEELMANAPEKVGNLFKVPPVV